MDRENQRIAITKRLLKESMLRLMKEKDVDKINVTELCRDAGVNRATFYRHYEIPKDVMVEIEKDLYYTMRKKVPLPKAPDDIRFCLEKICAIMEENMDVLQILIRSNTDMDFAVFINEIYLEIWNESGAKTLFPNYSKEDVELMSLYCAGGSYFVLRQWVLGKTRRTPSEITDYIIKLMNNIDIDMLSRQLSLGKKK